MESQPLLNEEPDTAADLQALERQTRNRKAIRILGLFILSVLTAGFIFTIALLLFPHLFNVPSLAKDHDGSRSTTRGYNASAEYIIGFLRNHTDYTVWTQPVTVTDQRDRSSPILKLHDTSINTLTFEPSVDYASFRGSGSGSLINSLAFHVIGCEPLDLSIFTTRPNAIAVIGMTNAPGRIVNPLCPTYCSRAAAAVKAGAKGIIFYPNPLAYGYPRPLPPSIRGRCSAEDYAELGKVPVVGMSQSAGFGILQRVVAPEGVRVTLVTDTKLEPVTVVNVLAETKEGDDESVVFFTSHLDSVPAGPGVNDDGSGATATLELAHAFYRTGLHKSTVQKLRFGWWCAEETGLEGSRYYVEDLYTRDPTSLYHIKLNIDTDMIASPNFVRGIWDGHGLKDEKLSQSAGVIQDVIQGFFEGKGLETTPFEFNGRSDFVAFLNRGIPAGGVITGEDEIKTPEQAERFGGISGMVLDPCYHQKCDTVESLRGPGVQVLAENLAALGHTLQRFAEEKEIDRLLKGEKKL
ncbi:hypothetical protein BC829DRAFT_409191 [Chytridium lagenaria]|nr:hypothetical protein BC829DRAFT_409191 [Chytridium lagenaria]